MFLEPVPTSDVLKTAVKLKNKTSPGYDGISTKLLKESMYLIINPITHIINRSFDTGIVPHEMKMAKVVPIYKASDKMFIEELQTSKSATRIFQTT